MKRSYVSFLAALGLFAALLLRSGAARAGAAEGLRLWGEILVPSLLPFFAAAGLLQRMGLTERLGQLLSPALGRLFRLSGVGCGVFLLGLTGGYPMGAAAAAEAVETGRMGKEEAERLLFFSDNTGPAFAVGAVGTGVFHSASLGLVLWAVHAFTALLLGMWSGRGKTLPPFKERRGSVPALPFAGALTESVRSAVWALLGIGGNVVFFSSLLAVTGSLGFPAGAAAVLAARAGTDGTLLRALFTGALELSAGIGAMAGLPVSPSSLALGSFLLGWGGLCVHFQSLAVTAKAELDLKGRRRGKLLHGVLSAAVTYGAAAIFL